MARKSRKNQVLPESVQVQATEKTARQLLATAAYVRLSVENSGNSTDDTLQTQIKLVHNFIANHPDLKLADTYIDNGFTGTNFDRPEFERLMQDVKLGKIQCVVVKDLSRFGRDYLETGHYLETIFPRLNVRFIAVTDDFDSFRPGDVESLATPIKNLVNSLYAKDISNKLRAVNANKRKRGERCGSFPPYGLKLTEDRKNYLPDQETVPYVRAIYVWKLLDVNKHEIVRRLELLQAPSPRQLQRMHSDNTAHLQDNTTWLPGAVARILENPVYVGDTVTGKTKPLASSYKRVRTRREDWTVTTNTHEAVILRSDYDAVQEIADAAKQKWRAAIAENAEERAKLPDLFHGQVHCAGCGAPMVLLRRGSAAKPLFNVYTCKSDRHKYACYGTKIQERLLQALVMDQISVLIKAMCSRKKMLEEMTQNDTSKNVLHSLKRKAAYLSGKIAEAEERKSGLYEDWVMGLFDKTEYQGLKNMPEPIKTQFSQPFCVNAYVKTQAYNLYQARFSSVSMDNMTSETLSRHIDCVEKGIPSPGQEDAFKNSDKQEELRKLNEFNLRQSRQPVSFNELNARQASQQGRSTSPSHVHTRQQQKGHSSVPDQLHRNVPSR